MCYLKYSCIVFSLLFVVIFGAAVFRIKRNKTVYLDIRDKLLLRIALAQSVIVLLAHIFFTHYYLLFIQRIVTMLQEVTICLILAELTLKHLKLMRAFYWAVAGCIFTSGVLMIIVITTGHEFFLSEKSEIWVVMACVSFLVSIVTITMGIKLIRYDP